MRSIGNRVRNAYRSAVRALFPMPSRLSNVGYNKALWDQYAANWSPDRERDTCVSEADKSLPCLYLGEEWGTSDLAEIMAEYVWPNISHESVVAEIGPGGGRLASKVAPRVKQLHCFDVSSKMIVRCKAALKDYRNVSYVLLDAARLPGSLASAFDFIYSFGVFVHLDLHTMWKYFLEIHRVLQPRGKAFLHTANLSAPLGWERFASQQEYSVQGYYFVCPEIVSILAERASLKIIKHSSPAGRNVYPKRDYLVLLQKEFSSDP